MKRYELTQEKIYHNGKELFRIKALDSSWLCDCCRAWIRYKRTHEKVEGL